MWPVWPQVWAGQGRDQPGHGCGRGRGVASLALVVGEAEAWPAWPWVWARRGHGPAAAVTHLLQLQPHFVEGSQPVGLGSGHGVLTLLAFLTFSRPETEAGAS